MKVINMQNILEKDNISPRRYYPVAKTCSYGAPLTLIISARSYGKTFGFVLRGLKRWAKTGAQFAWVRRYDDETAKTAPTLLDDVLAHGYMDGYEFRYVGRRWEGRKSGDDSRPWATVCHCLTLSMGQSYKGVAFPLVDTVIFDEFIREVKTPPGYLREEVGVFLNLLKSVFRDRPRVHAFALANACDLTAPLLAFAGVRSESQIATPSGYSWHNNKSVLVHFAHDAEFMAQEAETVVGRLVQGTPYAGVMLGNQFANGGDNLIGSKPARARYRYGFVFESERFGVWSDDVTGVLYVNGKIPSGAGMLFTLQAGDMSVDVVMVERAAPFAKAIMRLFGFGRVLFDSAATRERFIKMLGLCGLR